MHLINFFLEEIERRYISKYFEIKLGHLVYQWAIPYWLYTHAHTRMRIYGMVIVSRNLERANENDGFKMTALELLLISLQRHNFNPVNSYKISQVLIKNDTMLFLFIRTRYKLCQLHQWYVFKNEILLVVQYILKGFSVMSKPINFLWIHF